MQKTKLAMTPSWLLASLLLSSVVQAQPAPQTTAEPTSAPAPEAAPFLWQVDGPAGSSWLLGTIHLAVGLNDLPAVVLERFDRARIVIFEADIRTIDPFAMLEMAQLPEDLPLSSLLRPDVWQALRDQLAMLPEAHLTRMQPWVIEAMLATMVVPTLVPLDMSLLARAAGAGQELRFLETWQEQVILMNGIPPEQAAADLTRWFDERDTLTDQLLDLIEDYRAGDMAGVEAIVLDPTELARSPETYEVTLFARNDAWMAPIRAALDEGNAFVAVGLGHMVGERGLIELLTAAGYTVARVSP